MDAIGIYLRRLLFSHNTLNLSAVQKIHNGTARLIFQVDDIELTTEIQKYKIQDAYFQQHMQGDVSVTPAVPINAVTPHMPAGLNDQDRVG
jgi:hypothetical protein